MMNLQSFMNPGDHIAELYSSMLSLAGQACAKVTDHTLTRSAESGSHLDKNKLSEFRSNEA